MKENKYYTPSLEEFHVGFEYERFSSNKYTQQEVYGWADFEDIAYDLAIPDRIRVKYLDKNDIESLGFTVDKDREYPGEYNFSKDKSIIGKFLTTDGVYTIEIFSTYFIIKNKSELKVLLKQLNVV